MLQRLGLLLVCLLALAKPSPVAADARTDFLLRMLTTSDQFRVRTQAAIALGTRPVEPAVLNALTEALRDEHPAVRSASASALELLKDPSVLTALRAARRDRDATVRGAVEHAIATLERQRPAGVARAEPTPPPAALGDSKYYVAVGVPSAQAPLPSDVLRQLREHMVKQVAEMEGVRVAPANEPQAAASSVVRGKKLVGYYLDSSVTKVEAQPSGALRAQVSVIVGTYPGRAMRVMLSGAATVSGAGSSEQAKRQAIEAAFTGALRRLPQAMQASAGRAD